MPMWMDSLLVVLIVAMAAGYLLRRFVRERRRGGCSSCSSCAPATSPSNSASRPGVELRISAARNGHANRAMS